MLVPMGKPLLPDAASTNGATLRNFDAAEGAAMNFSGSKCSAPSESESDDGSGVSLPSCVVPKPVLCVAPTSENSTPVGGISVTHGPATSDPGATSDAMRGFCSSYGSTPKRCDASQPRANPSGRLGGAALQPEAGHVAVAGPQDTTGSASDDECDFAVAIATALATAFGLSNPSEWRLVPAAPDEQPMQPSSPQLRRHLQNPSSWTRRPPPRHHLRHPMDRDSR